MDTFNKVFKVQCVLLIVTCLLSEAHFHYIDYQSEILRRGAGLRPIREVIPSPESENKIVDKNNLEISSTNASTHTTNNETNEREPNPSIEADYKDSTAGSNLSNGDAGVQDSLLDLQIGKPVPKGIDQNNNFTYSDDSSLLVEVKNPKVNTNSENDTAMPSVSLSNPDTADVTSLVEVNSLKPGDNTSLVAETPSSSTPTDSTVDSDLSNNNSTILSYSSDLQTEKSIIPSVGSNNNFADPDGTSNLVEASTPKLEVGPEITQVNISSTSETSLLSVPTSNPNTENDTSLLEVSTPEPENNLSVTQMNISSTNETPVSSISTSNPSTDETTLLPEVSTPKLEVNLEVTQVNIDSISETPLMSSVSTSTENVPLGVSRPEPKDNINVTEANIYSIDETPASSISTSNPSTDDTTLLLETSTPKLEVDFEVTRVNVGSTYETSSNADVTETDVNFMTETSSISPPDLNTEASGTTPVIPSTKPYHITKIPKRNITKVDNTSSGSSTGDEVVGKSSTNSNITTVVYTSPQPNQTSGTENSANFKTTETCSSTVRTSLIDFLSKIFTNVLKQLFGMFINALDKTFDEVFEPLLPSLMNEIASFLENVRIDVDKNVDMAVNFTLTNVLQIKSHTFDIIRDLEENLDFDTQRVASLKLNYTISVLFEKIESLLSEFSPAKPFKSTSIEEALGNISGLVHRTVDDFLQDVNEVAVNEIANSSIVKNSSLDITRLVDEFLSKQGSRFQQFTNDSEPFIELIDDLMKITVQYKNTFEKNMDSLLVDSLIEVNDKKGLFDELLNDIFVVLKNLRKNLLEAKLNRAKNAKIFADLDQIENSTLSNIKIIRTQILEQELQPEDSELNVNLDLIENSVNDSLRAVQLLFNNLKSIFESTSNGSVSGAFSLIESSLYNAIYSLQKEVPPVLDFHFSNSSMSLNMTIVNSTYDRILRNHSEQLYACEGGKGDFSTSRGIFTYPFEYLLVFTILVHNLVMW